MNLRQALVRARNILADGSIEDASLEGEILLRHLLGINSARLYAGLDLPLNEAQEKSLHDLLERRRRGEPSAYITGHKEFYGLDFIVNSSTLIPRPETELLVEKAVELARGSRISTIADIGTGCGAIAVSLAVNLPHATVYATDISPAALEVARSNCKKHGVIDRVVLLHGDLLEPLVKPVGLIVANLPYVRKVDLLKSPSLRYEPALALDGGKDGLDAIKSLCRQTRKKLRASGCLLIEIGEGQAKAVVAILRESFPGAVVKIYKDLAGIARVVDMRLTRA